MLFDFNMHLSSLSLENFKAIEARLKNVLTTTVEFRSEQRNLSQTKADQKATESDAHMSFSRQPKRSVIKNTQHVTV